MTHITLAQTIIFCNTQKGCELLDMYLWNEFKKRLNIVMYHGDKLQSAREEAVQQFATARSSIIIATDIADVGHVLQ